MQVRADSPTLSLGGNSQKVDKRNSGTTGAGGWVLSAYQRETIFEGTNLDSPAPTLDLRIPGLGTPFLASVGKQEKQPTTPLSVTDSDPFSDYLSYESDQGDTGEGGSNDLDGAPKASHVQKTSSKGNQPQLYCNTTVTLTPVKKPLSKAINITDQSPLDALCHRLHAPSDLPTSPTPISPKTPQPVLYSTLRPLGQERSIQVAASDKHSGREPGRQGGASHFTYNGPAPVPALPSNNSFPSVRKNTAQAYPQVNKQSLGIVQRFRQWYLRFAPVFTCLMAIVAAVILGVCSLGTQTGVSQLARLPAAAFADLEQVAKYVELYPSKVCLLKEGAPTTSQNCSSYNSLGLKPLDGVSLTDQSMRLVDIGLMMGFIFSIFFAAYLAITLLLASMLLNTLQLPVSHFARGAVSGSYREKLDQVYNLACQDDLKIVYWLWYGHHHVPLDLFFLTSVILGVVLATVKSGKTLVDVWTHETVVGAGVVVPPACLVLYLPAMLQSYGFLFKPFQQMTMLSYIPKSVPPEQEQRTLNETPFKDRSVAESSEAKASQTASNNSKSTKKKKFRWPSTAHASVTSSFVVFERPDSLLPSTLGSQPVVDTVSYMAKPPADYTQYRSAVTPSPRYASMPPIQSDATSGSSSSSFPNQEQWSQAYHTSPSTSQLLKRLQSGQACDPFVLSDGLLYVYIEEPGTTMELPRLMPPEGEIRDQLLHDTAARSRIADGRRISGTELAESMLRTLSKTYWWKDMEDTILEIVRTV